MATIRERLWDRYQEATRSVRARPVGTAPARERPRLLPAAGSGGRGEKQTVLVHGYKDDASVFGPLSLFMENLGLNSHAVTLSPSDCSAPMETLADQLKSYIDRSFAPGQPLELVGFSLGGIVARYYLQRLGGLTRTARLVSVATPHRGTWTAYASSLPGALQLRPDSPFLRDLNSDADRLAGIRTASIWTPLDLMVLPSFSSRLPFGENRTVWALQHQGLITGRRGMHAIVEQLLGPAGVPLIEARPSLGER